MSSSSGFGSSSSHGRQQMMNDVEVRHCRCKFEGKRLEAKRMTSWTDENPGRRFYGCRNWKTQNCGFFDWYDEPMSERAREVINGLKKENMKLVKLHESSKPPIDLEAEIEQLCMKLVK
ncbi:uncharacterized protein LOC131019043 [Salvia miltiorrhiza]|uniref:uncharacterized protein LOC131019043 n=1 Tax=Salvia miltiorrhiza TaxID=226208 RepID=UPI0025ABE1C3|nr:uncharacterized protein LOC131019043 [Salvia miltiorrhiza]